MTFSARCLRILLLGAACLALPAWADNLPPSAQLSALAERHFTRGAPVPPWVETASVLPPAPKGQSGALRLADLQMWVGDRPVSYVRRALTANDASALGTLGQLEVEFQPEYQELHLHRLTVHRGVEQMDQMAKADVRFLQRELGLEQGMYSGRVTASIVVSGLRVGDTVDLEYSIVGANAVLGRAFHESAQWDYAWPVAWRRIVLNAPEDQPVAIRMLGAETATQPTPVETRRAGRRISRIEARNLAAILQENNVPRDQDQYRWVQFSQDASWASVNAWARDLFSAAPAPAALEPALKEVRAARSKEEQVVKVLEFVQNEIRYLSLAFGENSHRPMAPEEVLARRYGDCKDKAMLATAMLRALGIEAHPVLVATYIGKGLNRLLPSTAVFDHAIVQVKLDGRTFYLDATRRGQHGALAQMGQVHEDSRVLVVEEGSRGLTTIPQAAPDTHLHLRTEQVTITALDQPAEFELATELRGVSAEEGRVYLERLGADERRKLAEGILVKRYPEAQLLDNVVVEDDQASNRLVMKYRFRIPHLFQKVGDNWHMRYLPSNMTELFPLPANAQRRMPLAVSAYPESYRYRLDITYPNTVAQRPEADSASVDDPAFRARRDIRFSGRSARVDMTLDFKADRVAPAQLAAYLRNQRKLDDMVGGTLRLLKTDFVDGAVRRSASPVGTARVEALLANVDRAVADAEVAGTDAADALCERALAHAWLGHAEDAERDASRAIAMQPQSGDMLRCRGDAYFVLGRFKDSEADLSRAMARGAGTSVSYLTRGLDRLYTDNPVAAQDFALAAEKAADSAGRLRAQVMQASAGSAPVAAALPLAASVDQAWLTAALNMFAQHSGPEHMLGVAGRGAAPPDRLTEAYFYAGRAAAAQGNVTKAKIYFQQAVGKQAVTSIYHAAAQHELKRLAH